MAKTRLGVAPPLFERWVRCENTPIFVDEEENGLGWVYIDPINLALVNVMKVPSVANPQEASYSINAYQIPADLDPVHIRNWFEWVYDQYPDRSPEETAGPVIEWLEFLQGTDLAKINIDELEVFQNARVRDLFLSDLSGLIDSEAKVLVQRQIASPLYFPNPKEMEAKGIIISENPEDLVNETLKEFNVPEC